MLDFPAMLTDIEVSVYYGNVETDKYYVKVTFCNLGMFANSFMVQPSKYEGNSLWWVQPPKHVQGKGKWVATIDFDKGYGLWAIIEEKAIKAVEQYKRDSMQNLVPSQDVVLTDIPDVEVDFSNIPF